MSVDLAVWTDALAHHTGASAGGLVIDWGVPRNRSGHAVLAVGAVVVWAAPLLSGAPVGKVRRRAEAGVGIAEPAAAVHTIGRWHRELSPRTSPTRR